ncbi:MAG: IS1182 family transposase [Burkholderiales bacterium]|nr:IS1182 family transposase [Bryobacterales bacterium]MCZ2414625.1 IS1182 family transposase [Burkholderiales bacterium]
MSRFVQIDRDTAYLLPPSVQEWLPEDHLARFIVETVEQLDLSELNREYAGRGMAAFPPAMLLALLFYGYATGEFSSRRIERATYDSVAFRFIAANTHPDHDTIAAFRKRFLPQLKDLFVQILQVARALRLLKVGNVSLDGTKVKANASRHRALSYGHANRIEVQLKAEVEQLLRLAEQADRRDLPDGMDVPAEIARREARLAAIRAAKAQIEARAAERLAAEQQAYEAKRAARQAREKRTGKKFGGKPPKPPTGGVRETDQVSLTDEQSRIMKTSGGCFEQAYNAQALTDVDSKLIVGAFVAQHPIDVKQIEPALASLGELPEALGRPEHLLADTGYCSKDNVRRCEAVGLTPLIAMKRDAHHASVLERFAPDPVEAPGDDPMLRLHHRLATREGKALYAQRKITSEPVFGVIKHVLGFRQFLLRGLTAVNGEWRLVSIAWNLRRMHTMRLAG